MGGVGKLGAQVAALCFLGMQLVQHAAQARLQDLVLW